MSDNNLDEMRNIRSNLYGNLRNKQQGDYVDCCEEYKFVKSANTKSFNNKMNALGITDLVIKKEYNMNGFFIENIVEPVRFSDNIVIGIEGYTGAGKSELAQRITKISKVTNLKYKNRIAELFICWFVGDIYETLKEIKKGSIVWVDESPKTIGKGSRTEKWSVDNALHIIRKMENTFIFVDPIEIKVDICDLYLETAGQNRKTRTNRFMILDDNKRYFGHITTKLHDDEEFRDWYEVEKDIFIKETLEKGGRIQAAKELQELEIIEFNKELKKDTKTLRSLNVPEKKIEIYNLLKRGYIPDRIVKIFRYKNKNTITTARISQIKSEIKNILADLF